MYVDIKNTKIKHTNNPGIDTHMRKQRLADVLLRNNRGVKDIFKTTV